MVEESLTDPAKSLNKDLVNFASNIIVESSDKDNDLFKQFYDIIGYTRKNTRKNN